MDLLGNPCDNNMKIPKDMTEIEVIDQIEKVCNRIAPRYTFYGYTLDDIKQESFIICMEALKRYDNSRPLENFLSVNLSNRLKNFVRDNHFIHYDDGDRVRVLKPAQLEHENAVVDEKEDNVSYDSIEYKNMAEIIDVKIPAAIRLDYLRMINDVYITKQRREEIIETINEILQEHGYEDG
jgi:DNA-directed RNA polymerase specialized sigma24 family protein